MKRGIAIITLGAASAQYHLPRFNRGLVILNQSQPRLCGKVRRLLGFHLPPFTPFVTKPGYYLVCSENWLFCKIRSITSVSIAL